MELFEHQKLAVDKLQTGSILRGGVGSGKSRTALTYYFVKECKGELEINREGEYKEMKEPKPLYIITTARKRDTLDWEGEALPFLITKEQMTVDSWNNIAKYVDVKNSFFIFDEQRLVGYGKWVKSFLKIVKNNNNWILLSATPGDTWMDYIPVFIANGFYKNKTEFITRHVIYSRYSKYPKVDRYLESGKLVRLKNQITVDMDYIKKTKAHHITTIVPFDKDKERQILKKRWNIFKDKPIKNVSELCFALRRMTNSDPGRLEKVKDIILDSKKTIIFYNFDYELDLLRSLGEELYMTTREWNGHKHEKIPDTDEWIYLVQYTSGAEGWNCIETNVVIFYSQNYSYRITTQAAGRIDRINTNFKDLYYYHIRSNSKIDMAILKALKSKKNFNVKNFKTE